MNPFPTLWMLALKSQYKLMLPEAGLTCNVQELQIVNGLVTFLHKLVFMLIQET